MYRFLLQQNADNFNWTETRRRFLFICIMCKHVCGSTFISIQVVMTWYHIQHHPFSAIKFHFPISLISHHAVFMELTCQHLILKKKWKSVQSHKILDYIVLQCGILQYKACCLYDLCVCIRYIFSMNRKFQSLDVIKVTYGVTFWIMELFKNIPGKLSISVFSISTW